jgi:hypothetical protein
MHRPHARPNGDGSDRRLKIGQRAERWSATALTYWQPRERIHARMPRFLLRLARNHAPAGRRSLPFVRGSASQARPATSAHLLVNVRLTNARVDIEDNTKAKSPGCALSWRQADESGTARAYDVPAHATR